MLHNYEMTLGPETAYFRIRRLTLVQNNRDVASSESRHGHGVDSRTEYVQTQGGSDGGRLGSSLVWTDRVQHRSFRGQ